MSDSVNIEGAQPVVAKQPASNQAPARNRSVIAWLLALFLLFGAGLFLGRYVIPAEEFNYDSPLSFVSVEEGERQLIFPTFWEAWDNLHNKFIGDLEDKDLYYGAVAGMVRAANDPYTVFSPPVVTKQFEETISGSFSGVGIEIGVRNSVITVISPLTGSPADQAGIKESDIIVAVDDKPITSETSLDEVVQSIRGKRGEEVVISVFREGESETKNITIVRDKIDIESVKVTIDDDNTIAYINITSFNGDTAARFTEAARDIKKRQVRGIIIDVRNDPGGFLDTAVDIASRFLPEGSVVVSEQGNDDKEYKASGTPILIDIPVVVLINGGSASASEILAGALHDHLNAPLVGTKSFGKGSVQEFIKLSDDSSLRVTVARWYTPNNVSIDEEGIEPTVLVENNPDTEEDDQLQQARIELLGLIEQ